MTGLRMAMIIALSCPAACRESMLERQERVFHTASGDSAKECAVADRLYDEAISAADQVAAQHWRQERDTMCAMSTLLAGTDAAK